MSEQQHRIQFPRVKLGTQGLEALKQLPREKVQLGTKFGFVKLDATGAVVINGTPEYVRRCVEGSLQRLDVQYIDLYYQHRVDTNTPIEHTINGRTEEVGGGGEIKYIGVSEASADTIKRAHAVHPITAVQLEWSPWAREIEEEIVPLCRELGIRRGFFGWKAILESVPESSVLV
ncbi:hypothetical protein V6N12_014559 [Hibiscus sabdariffa]|uniref:NADP-dependent oxidoreductase domain-containing protein n=1 Tax=Hibiscus sabdariffa TaxID=183260 RepID=A0ABR2DM21_9ROSI